MLSSQLFWRVFAVYAALTIGTAVAFVVILTVRQSEVVQQEAMLAAKQDNAAICALLQHAQYAQGPMSDDLRGWLQALARTMESHAAVIGPDGSIVWQSPSNDQDWQQIVDQAARGWQQLQTGKSSVPGIPEEVLAAHHDGSGTTVRSLQPPSGTTTSPAVFDAVKLDRSSDQSSLVYVKLPRSPVLDGFSSAYSQMWAAAAGIGILALACTYVVVGRIIGPLETLTQAAQQITDGESPSEVTVRSRNEIGTLATAFNTMSRQLTARIQDLQVQRQQLETNHQRLETVLGAMHEGVVAVDDDEKILFANNAAIRLMDLKPVSMLGRPLWEAVRHQPLHQLVKRVLHDGGLQQVEFDVARTQSTVAVTASGLPGDPPPGAVIVFHDITELRRLESLRRDFVQNVSHELKTPLSSIAAYADTLLEGGLEDMGRNRQFVERIAEQAERLHQLIIDLLALARLESVEDGFEVEPTDVTKVLTASIDAHAGVAQAKRISLIAEGATCPIWGLADDEGLRTIIDNLLDNAVNYTPVGGSIRVRWQQRDQGAVIFQVQDSGVGIAHEHQQRIFQRFYRIDKARSREVGGTGLGLSIVKHLCQLFGGSVSVSSQLGQGSTFTVELRGTTELHPVTMR